MTGWCSSSLPPPAPSTMADPWGRLSTRAVCSSPSDGVELWMTCTNKAPSTSCLIMLYSCGCFQSDVTDEKNARSCHLPTFMLRCDRKGSWSRLVHTLHQSHSCLHSANTDDRIN